MGLQRLLNHYGKHNIPFFFIISYDKNSWDIIPLDRLPDDILFDIVPAVYTNKKQYLTIDKKPLSFAQYKVMFDKVIDNIKAGNTYLLNLTSQTEIKNHLILKDIFLYSSAKYKLFYRNRFVSFSPESFIKIENNQINTFPMKGTISANIPDAKEKILNNKKELAEHTMIVDLLRNDLNMVSKNVRVKKFRYIDTIDAGKNKLLQVSSHITGQLESNWRAHIGDIVIPLLPAGSISGTPKKMTIKLINEIENYDRGFFTGIWGIFDGNSLDSCVLIRFIEKLKNNHLVYKSGGGVTIDSDAKSEYNEMLDKIYIP